MLGRDKRTIQKWERGEIRIALEDFLDVFDTLHLPWRDTRMKWHRALGFGADNYRFHDHDKLAHYANAATDIEYNFPRTGRWGSTSDTGFCGCA